MVAKNSVSAIFVHCVTSSTEGLEEFYEILSEIFLDQAPSKTAAKDSVQWRLTWWRHRQRRTEEQVKAFQSLRRGRHNGDQRR